MKIRGVFSVHLKDSVWIRPSELFCVDKGNVFSSIVRVREQLTIGGTA